LVVVHGQTIVEPVPAGTNRAAIEAGVDILAHPGLITAEDVHLAAERGVALEISARRGHSLTNGHVLRLARSVGATLVLNTDAHGPYDLIAESYARSILQGAGCDLEELQPILENSVRIAQSKVSMSAASPSS
jgi:histidinol phosphatase-like PHP family hydrolase